MLMLIFFFIAGSVTGAPLVSLLYLTNDCIGPPAKETLEDARSQMVGE